jgi:hypothetical protein
MDLMSETVVEYVTGDAVMDEVVEGSVSPTPEISELVPILETAEVPGDVASTPIVVGARDETSQSSTIETVIPGGEEVMVGVPPNEDVGIEPVALNIATTTPTDSPVLLDGLPITLVLDEVEHGFTVTLSAHTLSIGKHTVVFKFGDRVSELSFTFGGDVLALLPIDTDRVVYRVSDSSGVQTLWIREMTAGLVSFVELADETTMRRDSPLSSEVGNIFWLAPGALAYNGYDTVARTYFSQSLERRDTSEITINGDEYEIGLRAGGIEIGRIESE